MNSQQFSIIGCEHGHITMFIEDMLRLGYSCAGLYEPRNTALAGAIAGKYKLPLVTDIEACLAPGVSLVGSAAINNEKINIIELCEQRGKHLMVDKPAVVDAAGLGRLKPILERGRIKIGMMLTSRYTASMQALKRLIASGELGDIVHLSMQKPHRLSPGSRPEWHFSKAQCGGIVIDLFIHDLDLLRWLTGKEIASVQGMAAKHILPEYPDFYDTASLQVRMDGGVISSLYADWHTPDKSWIWGDFRVFVTGTKGKAEARMAGDPLISPDEMLLVVTNDKPWAAVPLEPVQGNLTEDFLGRIGQQQRSAGKGGQTFDAGAGITHHDIWTASSAAIDADHATHYHNGGLQ